MKREIYNELIAWKNGKERKPLIVDGARQVGKTWILKHFGENEYKNVAYINCDKEPVVEHRWDELSMLANKFKDLLRQYYYVGGMPEVVKTYFSTNNLQEVRRIQKRIIADYEADFSKHIPAVDLPKVQMI